MANTLKAFYYLNTNILKLSNARSNRAGGSVLNGATGTAQVLDKNMAAVVNGGPLPLVYTANSQGEYTVEFPPTIVVPVGQFLFIEVLMNGGTGLTYRAIIEARVVA